MKFYRILILSLFAYILISCGGAEERKSIYMEKAKASIEAGDLDKARIELKNVLQIDPKDGEVYYRLGTVYEQQKNYRKAYRYYLKAEELSPELLANHAKLGRFYLLLMNDVEKTQEKVDLILSKDEKNSEGLLLKAALLVKEDKTSDAKVIARNILKREPGNVDAVKFLTTFLLKENDVSEAENVLSNALDVKKDNEQLNVLMAAVHIRNKDYERAEAIYYGFLDKYPENRSVYEKLASLHHLAGDEVKAEKVLRDSIQKQPDDPKRYLVLVGYVNEIKGEDEAIKEMRASVSKRKDIGKLRIALAELLYLKGKNQGAIDVYLSAVNDFPEELTGVQSRTALASLYIKDKEINKAEEIIESAIEISPNDPKINFIRAKLAMRKKDFEKAIIALRIVNKETPENIEAYFLLANIYQLEKNTEQANSVLVSAHDNNKTNSEALLLLSRYYMSRDIDRAEKIIDQYNKLKKDDYKGLSIKALIRNQKNSKVEANEIAQKLIELYPDKPNGYLQAIQLYGEKGDKKGAVALLEQGYINVKENRKLLAILVKLEVSEKRYSAAKKRVKAELESTPDDVELNIMLSKIYLSKGNSGDAEILLKNVIKKRPDVEIPYLLLSRMYKANNNSLALVNILKDGKENVRGRSSYKIPLKLASLYEENKNYSAAIQIYKDMYEIHPTNLIVLNNLASMLSDHNDSEADLVLAKKLAEKLKDSNQPVYLDTIGWVYYRLGDHKSAIKYLEQVVERGPEINVFNYHLGMAYILSGDKVQAKKFLEKSLADKKYYREKVEAEAALKNL